MGFTNDILELTNRIWFHLHSADLYRLRHPQVDTEMWKHWKNTEEQARSKQVEPTFH
jgi:hypothetical protein